jgi:hypothetical protein
MKVNLPISNMPIEPYLGGGGGAHFQVSDADLLIAYIQTETGGETEMNPYDHVHPGVHGVAGVRFDPPVLPISAFGEYKITKPLGDLAGDAVSMFIFGVNLGF